MPTICTPIARALFTAFALLALSPGAFAAEFAGQVTKIVVPFAPGGGTDIISRTLAQEMQKQLGGSVIVENKPGAGTIVGTEYVAKAEPDGHTLVMATFAHAVNPSLRSKLPFDADKDFAPVALVARSFNIVVVNPSSGINSIADLIAAAKAKPDGLNFGTFGPGTSAHLAGELFKSLAHVKMTAVHYKGAAPAITDLLGGTIQVMFTTVASATSLIKAGKLKALAVTSATRTKAFPDLPTVAEAGVPGYAAESWYGVFAPAKTPPATIALLNKAIDQSLHAPSFDKLVANEGLIMVGGAPEELGRYVHEQELLWRRVVREAGIKVE
ncbi:MAG TPA: tripartite tricarboxylate transporter substrate binding protein [Pseudolabrys sp.]|uniref:Bug family tripartite tricarboxylate transporter substrate binding protein n=1 Tax=Pseudolabrys sp. TaxID=1960880 RepID=UPI002DDD7496|nr:tripartite tricarboxylate transporter substrate binding protein [Pseudolabrys sp.]HEV2631114.1 tripartite tricarboxylate transporter substrate binding protein [Pseudolabrys sp.]